jgi:hypothetical protein
LISGITGMRQNAHRHAGFRQLLDRAQPKCGTRCARLHQPGQRFVERGDGQVHANLVFSRDSGHEIGVARHQIGLGCDAEIEPALAGEHFQHLAGDLKAALGRLVRIGGGANPDRVAGL